MEITDTDRFALLKTLEILAPYLEDIVIVGGWVPLIHRHYGPIPSRHPSVRTMDIDVAIPRRLEDRGRPTIDELLISAGYSVQIYGSDIGAVKYEASSPVAEIEFLTPEIGRPGKPIVSVQSGLQAQALRYLQILLENANEINVNESLAGQDFSLVIRVPSPGAFIYQKGLTLNNRHAKADLPPSVATPWVRIPRSFQHTLSG